MTNAEIKKTITDELKKIGINSKQVSVSVRDSRYDTMVSATIRDLSLKEKDIEKIVNKQEEIRYDDHCQEILQGCNTFCTVKYDYNALVKYREENQIEEKCKKIYDEAEKKDAEGNIYLHYLIPGDERFLFTTTANKRDGEGLNVRTQAGNKNYRCFGGYDLVPIMTHYLLGHYGTLEEYNKWKEEEEIKYKEQCRIAAIQREIDEKKEAERKTTHEKAIDSINKNTTFEELAPENQHIFSSLRWANMNKNGTLKEYEEEVKNGAFYHRDAKATHKWTFKNFFDLDYFQNHLLSDFQQLAGLGGTYSDDTRLDAYKNVWDVPKEIRDTVKWVNLGIAVYLENSFQFFVDPQGYSYARYVALLN